MHHISDSSRTAHKFVKVVHAPAPCCINRQTVKKSLTVPTFVCWWFQIGLLVSLLWSVHCQREKPFFLFLQWDWNINCVLYRHVLQSFLFFFFLFQTDKVLNILNYNISQVGKESNPTSSGPSYVSILNFENGNCFRISSHRCQVR